MLSINRIRASGVNALLQRAFETGPGISMTFPALPLHCRSGFSRDAFHQSHQSIGRERPPTESIRNRTGNSMTFPALPLHCRSGFSRDAFHQSHQSIGRERPPTESIRNRTGNSMTFPALPLHCRSGFSRDALGQSGENHRTRITLCFGFSS
jgi:hypothetical protein